MSSTFSTPTKTAPRAIPGAPKKSKIAYPSEPFKTQTQKMAEERTRKLEEEYRVVRKELDAKHTPFSEEWNAIFYNHPTVQAWQADFFHRVNASSGW